MALPLLGIAATVLGIGGLAVSLTYLIEPVSLFVGIVVGLLVYTRAADIPLLDAFGTGWQNELGKAGVAVAFGWLAYRMFAFVLLGLGSLTLLVVTAVVFVGGGWILVLVLKELALELAGA